MSESTSQAPTAPRLPPKATNYPLVGCLPGLVSDTFSFIDKTQRKHGDIFELDLGFTKATAFCHARHVQHIFVDHARNYPKAGPMWDFMKSLMGEAMPITQGPIWKKHRRLVQPAFNHHAVSLLVDKIVEAVDECMGDWEQLAQAEKPFDVSKALERVTMNVMVHVMFGSDLSAEEAAQLNVAFSYILDYFMVGIVTNRIPNWLPVPGRARYHEALRLIDEVMSRIIERARRTNSQDNNLIALLLKAVDSESEEGMTQAQLRDEAMGFFLAGYETTASGMTWLFHSLTQHPDIADRVWAEMHAVLGDRKPELPDLMKMPYMRNVLQESLRVFSPSVWVPRMALEEDVIDGFRIPAGRMVVILTHWVNHNPMVWKDPHIFDPDRFTPEGSEGRHRYAWNVFGSGQRHCIAKEFALTESMIIMSRVLTRFSMTPVKGREPRPRVSASRLTKNGMWMNLWKRSPGVPQSQESEPSQQPTSRTA